MRASAQRKNPVKRAFSGLVGLPPEPEAAPAPASVPPAKRGRPRKHVSNAEKQEAYRKRRELKKVDEERRNLVAEIIRICRRMQQEQNLEWLQRKHDEFLELSLEELRTYLTELKKNPDSHGRLHNERSGEAERGEQSEMERIIAAKERQAELGGRRITPVGHGSDEADNLGGSPSVLGTAVDYKHEEKAQIISDLIKKHYSDSVCGLCGAPIIDRDAAERHLWAEYKKGLKQFHYYNTLIDPTLSIPIPPSMIEEAKLLYIQNKHLQAVWKHKKKARIS